MLNAITRIDPDAEGRARHLRQCARLAEIGMELVEAAHQEALDDIRIHPDRRISPYSGQPAPLDGRSTTFAELFALLSRCVRQAILLEARLAAGAYDHFASQNHAPRQHPAAEPQAAHPVHPAHAAPATVTADRLRPEQIEDDLVADAHRSADDVLAGIRTGLGAAIDAGLVPSRPNPDAQAHAAPPSDRPRRPPPPLTQAERARLAFLRQDAQPASHPPDDTDAPYCSSVSCAGSADGAPKRDPCQVSRKGWPV